MVISIRPAPQQLARSVRVGRIMSSHRTSESHYDNHRREAELHDTAEHLHRVGEHQGKPEHLTGSEHTRQAGEHAANGHTQTGPATVGHGILAFGHDDIAARAHELWQARGCPEGSPGEDWFQAVKELRGRVIS